MGLSDRASGMPLGPDGQTSGNADLIVQVARQQFEERGVAKTSISRIMRETGFSRELFYYYFDGKDDLFDKVLDSYAADAIDSVRLWVEQCSSGEHGFDDFVSYFRRFLYDASGNHRRMSAVLEETGSLYDVIGRATRGSAELLRGTQFWRSCERRGIANVDLAIVFALCGSLGLLRMDPPATDEEIAAIARGVFRLGA